MKSSNGPARLTEVHPRCLLALALVLACDRPAAPAPAPITTTPGARASAQAPTPSPASTPAPAPEAPPEAEARRTRGTIVLVPLRSFPDDLMDDLEAKLRAEFEVDVERHEPVELPKDAYYKPRRRYRADALLDFLEAMPAAQRERTHLLGLTEVDISVTNPPHKDWGVFGYGQMPGVAAVISSFRLKRKAKSREHVRFRVSTTALHEVGHNFGLPHCPEARCFMQDAEGSIANTDSATGTLASGCRHKLDRLAPLRPVASDS